MDYSAQSVIAFCFSALSCLETSLHKARLDEVCKTLNNEQALLGEMISHLSFKHLIHIFRSKTLKNINPKLL